MGWIGAIIIGGLAGWIAEKIMKFDTGLLMNIVLGIAGSIVGNLLLGTLFGIVWGGIIGQLVIAVVGACILIFGYRALQGRSTG